MSRAIQIYIISNISLCISKNVPTDLNTSFRVTGEIYIYIFFFFFARGKGGVGISYSKKLVELT